MWFLDFFIKGILFWFIVQIFFNGHIRRLSQVIIKLTKTYEETPSKKCCYDIYHSSKHNKRECSVNINEQDIKNDIHIKKNDDKYDNGKYNGSNYSNKEDSQDQSREINKAYVHENKKFGCSEYDIEKVYAIKFNHISKFHPDNGPLENGFIWLNTSNSTINIYYDHHFHEFPILYKSIVKQYIKRPIKNISCGC